MGIQIGPYLHTSHTLFTPKVFLQARDDHFLISASVGFSLQTASRLPTRHLQQALILRMRGAFDFDSALRATHLSFLNGPGLPFSFLHSFCERVVGFCYPWRTYPFLLFGVLMKFSILNARSHQHAFNVDSGITNTVFLPYYKEDTHVLPMHTLLPCTKKFRVLRFSISGLPSSDL